MALGHFLVFHLVAGLARSVDTHKVVLLNEEFDSIERWEHVVTSYRMGENQFQYYTNRPENSFIKDGKLFIKPTLTKDRFGEQFLHNGKFNLKREGCNLAFGNGCMLKPGDDIVNPIQSAALMTKRSFRFKYGTVEVRAKMPRGDWLWPEISFLPAHNVYGAWPRSGFIGLAAVRGNDNFTCQGKPMDNRLMEAYLEWGVDNNSSNATYIAWNKLLQDNSRFSSQFHIYRLEWNPNGISVYVDEELVGSMEPPVGGFWELSESKGSDNPWINGTLMAPFDQEFFIAVDVAVGGDLFSDDCENHPYPKPWNNSSPATSMSSFWGKRDQWYPTWSPSTDNSALEIDYIRVYAH